MLLNKRENQRAFTLLELLIVISIIGLLASIVMVSFPEAQRRARIAEAQQFAETLRASLQMDMVAWWPLDETSGSIAKDSWFDEIDGTVSGATWTDGVINGSLDFDGASNDYLITQQQMAVPQSYTLAVWVKGDLASQVPENIYNLGWNGKIALRHSSGGAPLTAILIRNGPDTGYYNVGTNTNHLDGGWHHLVATVDTQTLRVTVYLDGKIERERTISSHWLVSERITVGCWTTTYGNFTGLVDEPQIFGSALPQSVIQQYYAHGLATHQSLAKK